MPCYTPPPSQNEIEYSKTLALIEEINTGKLPSYYGTGCWPRDGDKPKHDIATKKLCEFLQTSDVAKYSLEMQIWWRDHQAHDKKRLEKEMKDKLTQVEKNIALSKLTDYEKKLLNL